MNDYRQIVEEMEKDTTITDYFFRYCKKYEKKTLLKVHNKQGVESVSYGELMTNAENVSLWMADKKWLHRHIGILGSASRGWITSFFGILNSSNVVVPMDELIDLENISKLIIKADVSVLLYDAECREKAEQIKQMYVQKLEVVSFEDLQNYVEVSQVRRPKSNELAMIVYTSGTTGESKGVMLTQENIYTDTIWSILSVGKNSFHPGETTLSIIPFFHMFGITAGLLFPFYFGVCIGLPGTEKNIYNNLNVLKPAYMVGVPMIAEGLNKIMKHSGGIDSLGGKFRVFISGGAFTEQSIIKQFQKAGIEYLCGYGITECSPVIACNSCGRVRENAVGKILSLPYCKVKIVDGEIWVSGTIVFKGYYHDEDQTSNTLENGWLKTGDLGYLDEDNYLYITGRKKNLIIRSDGNNVSAEELEKVIKKSDLIESAIVVNVHKGQAEKLKVIIYPKEEMVENKGKLKIQEEVEKYVYELNQNFPRYKQIDIVEIAEEPLEKTSLGKVRRCIYENKE